MLMLMRPVVMGMLVMDMLAVLVVMAILIVRLSLVRVRRLVVRVVARCLIFPCHLRCSHLDRLPSSLPEPTRRACATTNGADQKAAWVMRTNTSVESGQGNIPDGKEQHGAV
jgi:hypothetical protein